ncbi:MAG: crossover junction endodeoxyribonuclease RuvC [Candidatus Paceibacterota bacterium]
MSVWELRFWKKIVEIDARQYSTQPALKPRQNFLLQSGYLIGKEIEETIKKFSPEALAIEKLYFENNAKTAMGVRSSWRYSLCGKKFWFRNF